MATRKPLSTISYNSEAFLKEQLENFMEWHLIQSYMYICHKGEDGDKDHIHVRIEPNKSLDPMELTNLLKEYDPKRPDKPLCVRPWRNSKEEDWILYAVHDKKYLQIKYSGGDSKEKLPYEMDDIKANETFDVEIAFKRAKASLEHTGASLITRVKKGESISGMVEKGENPYLLATLMRTLQANDTNAIAHRYAQLQEAYDKCAQINEQLCQFLDMIGYCLEFDDKGGLNIKEKTNDQF